MFDCFKKKSPYIPMKDDPNYPAVAFVMTVSYKGGYPNIYGGVYESEYDAQQYCLDHSDDTHEYTYYIGQFIPPSEPIIIGYPTWVYPMTSKGPGSDHYVPAPAYVMASESDASSFVLEHSNSTTTFMYSIQYWFPTNSYSYQKNGFVGHKSTLFQGHKIVAPAHVINIENK